MAGVYRVTEEELRFLLMFVENQGLYGFDDMDLIETEAEAQECVKTLCEKGYLRLNTQKEYEVDSTLELLLTVAEHPYGYLIMEDLRKDNTVLKAAVYFLDDVIGMVEQKNKNYEMLWIPYLPLAIGEVANLHSPFINEKTIPIKEISMEEGTDHIDDYLKEGFMWQWEIWGRQFEDDKKCNIFVLSDGNEQFMIKEIDGRLFINKPDKASYVNAITEWLAFVHGNAIRRVIQEA